MTGFQDSRLTTRYTGGRCCGPTRQQAVKTSPKRHGGELKMSKKRKQHIVPKCYLSNFVDTRCPPGHSPYVWIIRIADWQVSRRAPANLLTSPDMYTIHLDDGTRSLVVEDTLADIEDEF